MSQTNDTANGATRAGKTIFLTGATGHIGSIITGFAVAEGYNVRAISRTEKGDEKLKALGATPIRGDLLALGLLRAEAAKADIVMHLADTFLDKQARQELYDEVIRIDADVVDAIAESLRGTDKPLIVSSGLVIKADPNGEETTEESPIDPDPFIERIRSERYAMSYADKGVKVICIRLAPFVYGRGGSGIFMLLSMAFQNKQAIYIEDGHWRTSTVHVDDAARLYLLAAEHGQAGQIFNATSQTTIDFKQMAEAIAGELDVPAVSLTREQTEAKMGWFLSKFLTNEVRGSNRKAVSVLGWQPREVGLIEEIKAGSYHRVAQQLLNSGA